jgi:hypothetical protein
MDLPVKPAEAREVVSAAVRVMYGHVIEKPFRGETPSVHGNLELSERTQCRGKKLKLIELASLELVFICIGSSKGELR